MNLLWYLVGVWLAVLIISPEEALWMGVAMLVIVMLAWGLDALLHRNDKRNVP